MTPRPIILAPTPPPKDRQMEDRKIVVDALNTIIKRPIK